jgi:chromosome segregation ATPase
MQSSQERAEMADTVGEMPKPQPTAASETPAAAPQAQSDLAAELERTRAALKQANSEAAERRKRLEALETAEAKKKESELSEVEKLTKRLQEAEAKLSQKEKTEARRAVAEKVGLPAAFASRLQGETPEEMEADAKALLEALPKTTKPQPGPVTNPGAQGSKEETRDQKRARLFGTSSDIWGGGGVRGT